VVIPPQFAAARPFSEGLAAVSVRGRWGYIDETGQVVIQPQFEVAYGFEEGLAAVLPKEPKAVEIVGRYGYIDRTGRLVISARFTGAGGFTNGLAAVRTNNPFKDHTRENWGFIDKTGRLVIADKYEHVEPFQEGLALAIQDDRYYYLDPTGAVVLQAKKADGRPLAGHEGWPKDGARGPDEASGFSDGLARISVGAQDSILYITPGPCHFTFSGGKSEFISRKTGGVVIAPQFDDAGDFCEGLAPVTVITTTPIIPREGPVDLCAAALVLRGRADRREG
jgi:hypothetical protein